MRLKEIHGADAITRNAGFVRDGADDIAHTHLVALADTEEHPLLAATRARGRRSPLTA